MPKVFVTQEVLGRDISSAERYGKIIVMLPPGDFNHSVNHSADTLKNHLSYMQDDDWLLLMGDPVLIAVAAAIAYDVNGKLKLLKWDKFKYDYLPVIYNNGAD